MGSKSKAAHWFNGVRRPGPESGIGRIVKGASRERKIIGAGPSKKALDRQRRKSKSFLKTFAAGVMA